MRLLFRKLLPSILGTTDKYELEPVSANASTAINRSLARKSKPMFSESITTDHGLHAGHGHGHGGHDDVSIGSTKYGGHDDDQHSQRHAASCESITELVNDSDEDLKKMRDKV